MIMRTLFSTLIFTLGATTVLAQPHDRDPLSRALFAPELVMRHQHQLQLTPDQSDQIKAALQAARSEFTGLEWDLQESMQTMLRLLHEPRVDEDAAITHLDMILDLERAIKRNQLSLVIRMKNLLTPEQQAKLRQMKQQQEARAERH